MPDAMTVFRTLFDDLAEYGFVHVSSSDMQAILNWSARSWTSFAASWARLGQDRYMADGGRYRRRRHAAFEAHGPDIRRKVHQPHFQSRDYNALNGDVQRWFEPVEDVVAASAVTRAIFSSLTPVFDALDGRDEPARWHSEFHQFRIESSASEEGRPTPEGMHRDGVDWVFVMLVGRRNVEEGVTEIGNAAGQPLGRFMLREPGEAVLLDDRRIRHGVTPVRPVLDGQAAYRDALVVTWQAAVDDPAP